MTTETLKKPESYSEKLKTSREEARIAKEAAKNAPPAYEVQGYVVAQDGLTIPSLNILDVSQIGSPKGETAYVLFVISYAKQGVLRTSQFKYTTGTHRSLELANAAAARDLDNIRAEIAWLAHVER